MMIFPPSLDCWRFDSHERPNFQTIIDRLDDIAHSNLPKFPDEFHEMQNDWRLEIGDRMEEIRVKEYVSLIQCYVDILSLTVARADVAGASQPGGEPGGDPESSETAGAAAAAARGRAGRARTDSAAARAPHDDGPATTQPGHAHS